MKIDVLGVQAFVVIADHKSFRRAAGELSITQTAPSRRLQNLESFLGVRLVERTTRSVALTPPGDSFLPQARRLLADLAAALTEIRETGKAQRGDVTLACVPTIGVHYLPHILQRYSAEHPQNRVKVLDHSSGAVAQAVLTREAEFGINIAETHAPTLRSIAAAGRLRADLPRGPSAGATPHAALGKTGGSSADLSRRQQQQPAAARSRAGRAGAAADGLL